VEKEITMLERVDEIIAAHADCDRKSLRDDMDLVEELELDSFEMMQMIPEFEDEYAIHIADADLKNFRTVGDIRRYIGEKTGKTPESAGRRSA
jgi:acyl carrier protein